MKKYIFVLLMAIAIVSTGCKQKAQQSSTASDSITTTTTDTLTVDSIVYHALQDSTVSCDLRVDFPTGSDSLSMAVTQFLAKELSKQYLPLINDDNNKDKYKPYRGALDKHQAIVDYYGKGSMDYLVATQNEMKEMMKNEASEDFTPQIPRMSYELTITKSCETERYLTYNVFNYTYLGGAHGSATDYSVNISKATGKPLAMTVDTLKVKALQPIIRKGIIQYINKQGQDPDANEKNLNSYLFLDGNTIPLPAITPYLDKDGVHFIYQQYEIGPYAMGFIQFVVPYSQIKPYLTPEALKLIAQ